MNSYVKNCINKYCEPLHAFALPFFMASMFCENEQCLLHGNICFFLSFFSATYKISNTINTHFSIYSTCTIFVHAFHYRLCTIYFSNKKKKNYVLYIWLKIRNCVYAFKKETVYDFIFLFLIDDDFNINWPFSCSSSLWMLICEQLRGNAIYVISLLVLTS